MAIGFIIMGFMPCMPIAPMPMLGFMLLRRARVAAAAAAAAVLGAGARPLSAS
jgi:hypothetical protein